MQQLSNVTSVFILRMTFLRYSLMVRAILLMITTVLLAFAGRSSHVIGGDITWTCNGGDYVFQLTFYRDCNGGEINPVSETIDVWGHPTISSIQVDFVSRTDVSPICTEVPGGPGALACGSGQGGGNGIGAIEKIVYQSAPITLTGTPPTEGWAFTYQNFSRPNTVTNLIDPDLRGLTLVSTMYEIPGSTGGCVDNSPQFLQDPYFVSCVGDPYEYNMNAVDPDLDSMHISFSAPLDHFPGGTYNPPTTPTPVAFENGFSAISPTPGTGLNPGNVPAQVNANNGNLTFLSNNSGSYVIKITARSYRNGVLIAEVDREILAILINCSGTNMKPTIAGPFGGLFETTVNAGDLVNFTLNATDVELLQDGSPQSNHLSASGLLFGTNFTNPAAGCATGPCATLNATPLITGVQGVSTTFDWQTSCDHLETPYGYTADMIPYHFVFKVQDDYCPVPKVSYATVTVNVVNPGVIQAPDINCIQSDINGDVTITWDAVNDPLGTFNEYQIYTEQGGLVGTVPAIGTTTFTDPAVGQQNNYFLAVASGCNGNTIRFGDTISNIYLDLNNPSNGTAVLQWNDPISPALPGMNGYYHIYREYPAGIWTLHDSVPYGTNFFIDTIDICDTWLNYQIVLPNSPCDFTSNIAGDQFQDMMTPVIPVIESITIDTLTGDVIITWDENAQPDTYGYVIYVQDENGIVVELDTVWGISNTTYIHDTITSTGPLTYSVAAFDSCWTPAVPPTYQTSAKAPPHTTMFITPSINICAREANLSWTPYVGWNNLDHYEIYALTNTGGWQNLGSTTETSYIATVQDGQNYCFLVKAVSMTGIESFSNRSCIFVATPGQPQFNYLQVATVNGEEVDLTLHIDLSANISDVIFQRMNTQGVYEDLATLPASSGTISFTDDSVDVNSLSYTYRVQVLDSCNQRGSISNEAQTILLQVNQDNVAKLNYLFWNPYREFNGAIIGYNVYRGIDGVFSGSPLATLSSNEWSFEDDVNDIISTGKICYRVEAIEAVNFYGFSETSLSNDRCVVLPPLIYIPNAFMPDGINKVFKPIISDFDAEQYELIIYDRWGQPIFITNYYDEGWDGIIQGTGNIAQTGVYLYRVQVVDGNGVEIVKRGHVSLLK